ncbi:MAG: diacylglyceryl transferase [Hymenobacter sp.]|nr:MAG: diacylglyceryl transferase [Hymenobacter sp.]
MHFPVSIHLFGKSILLHVVLETAAFFIGFRYYLYLKKRQSDKIAADNRIWILIGAMTGALVGSRLIGGLEQPTEMLQAPNKLWYFYQNKTVLGGLLGGLLGVEGIKRIIGEKHSSGDLLTFPILLALIIGRIGCFTMGVYEETYGLPTSSIFGMHLGDAYLRHPVALYEMVFAILLWWLFAKLRNTYPLADGAVFKIFMIAYCVFRFGLDFIKPHYTYSVGLSTIQIVSLLGLLYYYRYIFHPRKLLLAHG